MVSSAILFLNLFIVFILVARKIVGKPIRNIHILSLSITDTLVGVNVIPISMTVKGMTGGHIILDYDMCWLRMSLYTTCLVASYFHVLFICVDRCTLLSNCYNPSVKNARLRFCTEIILSWLCAAMCVLLPFHILKRERSIPFCSLATVFTDRDGRSLLKIWSVLFLCGILIVIGSCVWMIARIIHNSRRNNVFPERPSQRLTHATSKSVQIIYVEPLPRVRKEAVISFVNVGTTSNNTINYVHQRVTRSQRAAIKTITIMAICMIICLIPLNIMFFLEGWKGFSFLTSKQRLLIIYIASLNSAFNPVIYSFRIYEVRETLKLIKEKINCCHVYCYLHEH